MAAASPARSPRRSQVRASPPPSSSKKRRAPQELDLDESTSSRADKGKGKGASRGGDEDDPVELMSEDDDEEEEEEEYEVDSIRQHKYNKKTGSWKFLVHWAGYDSDWDTWEPEVSGSGALTTASFIH